MTKSDRELRDEDAENYGIDVYEAIKGDIECFGCSSWIDILSSAFSNGFDSRQAQVDQLRAEVEELRHNLVAARAEVEPLKGLKNITDLAKTVTGRDPTDIAYQIVETDQIKAMAERLAEALEGIYKRHLWQPALDECACEQHREASQALADWKAFREGK
jgi:hypothetical protein